MIPEKTDFSVRKILGLDFTKYQGESSEPPKKRQRRTRTVFSNSSIRVLEEAFSLNCYPDVYARTEIANYIGEDEARVQVWFQNRRARVKRKGYEAHFKPINNVIDTRSSSPAPTSISSSSSRLTASQVTFKPKPIRPEPISLHAQVPSIHGFYSFQQFLPFSYHHHPTQLGVSTYCMNRGDEATSGESIVESPPWSPGASTFQRLFTFPSQPVSPLPDSPTKRSPEEENTFHSEPYLSGHVITVPASINFTNCSALDLSQSEDRPADSKTLHSLPSPADSDGPDTFSSVYSQHHCTVASYSSFDDSVVQGTSCQSNGNIDPVISDLDDCDSFLPIDLSVQTTDSGIGHTSENLCL